MFPKRKHILKNNKNQYIPLTPIRPIKNRLKCLITTARKCIQFIRINFIRNVPQIPEDTGESQEKKRAGD